MRLCTFRVDFITDFCLVYLLHMGWVIRNLAFYEYKIREVRVKVVFTLKAEQAKTQKVLVLGLC